MLVGLACGWASLPVDDPTVDPTGPLLMVTSSRGDGYVNDAGQWVLLPPVLGASTATRHPTSV